MRLWGARLGALSAHARWGARLGLLALALWVGFVLGLGGSGVARAQPAGEEARLERLRAHLKKVNDPFFWLLIKKFFSADDERREAAFRRCRLHEGAWAWYLYPRYFHTFAYEVDFVPAGLDADPDLETLVVLRTDRSEVNYISLCLLDDAKRAHRVLASYSDLSHRRPVTLQLKDLTGDGRTEVLLFSREGPPGALSDGVRVIKYRDREFVLIWSGRLSDRLEWPPRKGGKELVVRRSEELRGELRVRFEGAGKPARLVVRGTLLYKVRRTRADGTGPAEEERTVLPFEEAYHWDRRQFRYVYGGRGG